MPARACVRVGEGARISERFGARRQAGDALEASTGAPVRDAGYRAIDSLSAEKNYRHWHADLANSDTPLEAGIGFTVLPKLKRLDTPQFIGREVCACLPVVRFNSQREGASLTCF